MEMLLLFVLILINAFFAACEVSLISLNDTKIEQMATSGNRKAILLQKILQEPTRFLSTIQVGITLAGFNASASASEAFAAGMTDSIVSLTGLSVASVRPISQFLITLILSFFTIVLGELVPKRLAMKQSEKVAFAVVKPIRVMSIIALPFVRLLSGSTNLVLRLLGVDPSEQGSNVTEEEIRMMVDVGEEKGTIQESEREVINNIFDFDNLTIEEIMTHRTEIEGINVQTTLDDVINYVNQERFTRYPVYDKSLDNIIGILHVKDLLRYLYDAHQDKQHFSLSKIIRKPYFVPDSKHANELFSEFQRTKTHIAIVIDEYGGTAGLVTMEDLIEEILGNIFDEYDEEEQPEIHEVNHDTYVIEGSADLEDVAELLKIDLPTDEYETLSGYVIGQMGRLPEQGEQFSFDEQGWHFSVLDVDEKVIGHLRVERLEAPLDDRDQSIDEA